jgi:hypothetical protein
MCLVTYLPGGVKLTSKHRERLCNGARVHPHGHGWAFAYDGNLIVKHYLEPELAIAEFVAMRSAFPGSEAAFHSRTASVTATGSLDACHPVWVGGERKKVLFHNGFLFAAPDGRTDTQVFAGDVLPRWDLSDGKQRAALELLMGDSKAVVLSADGETFVLNADQGVLMPDGTWYSNTTFNGVPLVAAGRCASCGCASVTRICGNCQTQAESRRISMVGA